MKEICQVCGKPITGKPYYWNNDGRLPMHPSLSLYGPEALQALAEYMNRNKAYINGSDQVVLIA